MAKKVQLMTNAKEWQTVDGVEVLIDVPQEDLDPITDSSCVEIEGHRTLEETISQENMFTPEIVETKVHSKVGGVYHDNVVDGAYEEAILYGNTQVNLVESMTSDTKYIPHSFTSFQGNESKIGNYHNGRTNQVAPLVKGVTMVNLAQETNATVLGGGAVQIYNVKGNTLYSLFFTYTAKNTNAGITIQSFKDETYLENTKIQTNLSDKVVMTFTTHEQASKIHICNGTEFGGETIQLDNIMVIEGDVTDLDLPFFKGMRSVELSRPLTNLFTDDLDYRVTTNVVVTNSGGTITTTAQSITTWSCSAFYLNVKPNTEYLVMWDSLSYTHTDTTTQSTICVYGDSKNIAVINNTIKCSTLRSLTFNSAEYKTIELRFHATASNSETGVTTVTGLRVFEWDDSLRTLDLQTIGYFSGTKYVSVRALETEGKNLYPYGNINFTSTNASWFDSKGTELMYGDIGLKSKARFLLKKGSYIVSFSECTNVYNSNIQIVNDKEEIIRNVKIDNTSATFTLMNDTYCTVRVMPSATDVSVTVKNIQIERGETATSYEAYNGRYYKPRETEEIILRSLPNGICDTFNLQTGELVQNIGEIVLDGSEDEVWNTWFTEPDMTVWVLPKSFANLGSHAISDRYTVVDTAYGKTEEILAINPDNSRHIQIRLFKTTASNINEFKTYLQSNPITVQYELAEPIITKLQTYDRIYSGQTNALVGMSNNLSALTYRYSTDYLKVANLSPIPAILEPITSLPYNVRLKPSTLYTIKYSRGGNSNSMKFDLGGSIVEKTNSITDLTGIAEELTVRTPAILSHEQLILSGTGYAHNFIVTEGDITGTELPYFEGMKNVKMPIVKNVGKNLFDGELYIDMGINTSGTTATGYPTGMHPSEDWVTTKNLIPITKGKKISITIDADDEDITSNRRYVYVYKYDMNGNFMPNDRYDLGLNTKTYTMSHYGYIKCTIRTHNVKNITITETDTPQPCIDYRVNSIYAVQGEYPITSEMIEQGGFSMAISNDGSYENSKYDNTARLRSKNLIPVKPNTTYAICHTFSKFTYNVYQWNGNRAFIDGIIHFEKGDLETFTTSENTHYIHFLMSKHDASQAITVSEYDWNNFHMYELDSTINLRSLPNGVKDELNLLTGEYIQRVGEIVFNGSDDEIWGENNGSTTQTKRFIFGGLTDSGVSDDDSSLKQFLCDRLQTMRWNETSPLGIAVATTKVFLYNNSIDYSVSALKTWLQSNPITVQYELAEPIISHVRLVSNNQEREVGVKLPNGVCNTYNPSTGITTVRVGKVVLDGSEDEAWTTAKDNTGGAFRFETQLLSGKFNGTTTDTEVPILLCDKYATYKFYLIYNGEKVGISFYMSSHIVIYDNKYADLASFKQALQSNPITIWYELKYPQIQPDIVLPNGVHDEYNPETGVYTKKVGFVEFDGSEDEIWHEPFGASDDTPTIYSTWTSEPLPNVKCASISDRIPGICNSLKFHNDFLGKCNFEMYFISDSGRFNLNIERAKLSSGTAAAFNQYLSQNPIKLWYELATPITYQLTPYFGLPQPYAYEDGYLIHDSAYAETTLPPEFKYKLITNRTGQVMQNNRKLQEHTTRLSNLEAIIIEATIESLFNRELQLFELELMDVQLIDLGE